MSRLVSLFLLSFSIFSPGACAQLRITVYDSSQTSSVDKDIYIAGNFNQWSPNDLTYKLKKGKGSYELEFQPDTGMLSFKFTQGSWQSAEKDKSGNDVANRTFHYTGQKTNLLLTIAEWEHNQNFIVHTSTFNVTNFEFKKMDRRRIWVYLPPDYNEDPDKRYPVLYMQDGQNLFDRATSFSGEWGIDESLNEFYHKTGQSIIVVGIDNASEKRTFEYSPWVNEKHGGGGGESYVNALLNTVKPYIDSTYRTLPDRDHTGIMGSSMGGLISLYAAISHQEIFGKAGIFSPSIWFSKKSLSTILEYGKTDDVRFFLLAGVPEGDYVVNDVMRLEQTLYVAGFDEAEVAVDIQEDGTHQEWFWGREFVKAIEWLFFD